MKAFILDGYGSPDRLKLTDIEKPTPAENEVLIQIHAASVNAFDWRHIRAKPFLYRFSGAGLFKPKHTIPGVDVAGVVTEVGSAVQGFQPGDSVCADLSSCGLGAFAQYVCADEVVVASKPDCVDFDVAASIPMSAVTALQGLRDVGHISVGNEVAIIGASGGVGTFATQIAKTFDTVVTAVCDTDSVPGVTALGADHVIDYTKIDFTQQQQRYDLIFGISGYYPLTSYKRALTENGTYVMCGGTTSQILQALLLGPALSIGGTRKIKSFNAKPNKSDLEKIINLVKEKQIMPVIDKHYPLEQLVDAIRYLEQGNAYGKVIITIS